MALSNQLCECGCGGRTNIAPRTQASVGWIKGEPLRFVRGHSNRKSGVEVLEAPSTDCWIWQLGTTRDGYGQRTVNGEKRYAHRLYYEDLVGPIPEGFELDHLCRNTSCVNPGHLEPVTHAENCLRGYGSPALNARKTHCKRGHLFDEANTRINKRGHRECRACGRDKERERQRRLRAAA